MFGEGGLLKLLEIPADSLGLEPSAFAFFSLIFSVARTELFRITVAMKNSFWF